MAIPADIRAWIEEQVRKRGPVPKAEQIFRHGLGYHECALRCLELRDGHGFLFKPSLVVFAFVVEIYLKGLRAIDAKDTRWGGHNLSQIYGSLEAETQGRIAERYQQRHHQNLADDIAAYSKLFEQLRYSYELEGAHEADISGVAQLASSLYETWAELRPDLIQQGIIHERIVAPNQGIPII